jgi:glucose/mannose-6-phosphate isomerase
MNDLDNSNTYQTLDPQGMLGWIRELGEQCRQAWQQGQAIHLPPHYTDIDKVVLLGVGGSAIGGDIMRSLASLQSPVPVFNQRGYHLPPFVDERTLIIASSYSGNTEEVLSAFREALPLPAKKIAVTTGGRLLALAQSNDIPAITYAYEAEPRAALSYSLLLLLAIAERLELLADLDTDVRETCTAIEKLRDELDADVPLAANPAKQLALKLYGRLPVVYGAGHLSEVAHRWKTQFNENSKVWSFYEELPEANHNSIVGYAMPDDLKQRAMVILLRSDSLQPRILLHYEASRQALENAGVEHEILDVEQGCPLAQIMTGILYGDYVSYYLALLNGVEPTPTPTLQAAKNFLSGVKT